MNLKESFLEYCKKESLEVNQNQLKIIDQLNSYYKENFEKSFFKKFFKKKKHKARFLSSRRCWSRQDNVT